MVIQFYSDSLGLPRPSIVGLDQRYIYIFQEWLKTKNSEPLFLIDRSRGAQTIDKLYQWYKEDLDYIDEPKDILIIHEGICDCAPRPVSLRIRWIISKLPLFIRSRIISFLHNNRSRILKLGLGSVNVSKKEFEETLKQWLEDARLRYKSIYIFNIAPTNLETEQQSPGFTGNINEYNAIIKKIVLNFNYENLSLIDVNSLLKNKNNIDEYILKSDGHHLTAKAHQLYADCLINAVNRQFGQC